jgi:hypothetical protein
MSGILFKSSTSTVITGVFYSASLLFYATIATFLLYKILRKCINPCFVIRNWAAVFPFFLFIFQITVHVNAVFYVRYIINELDIPNKDKMDAITCLVHK